MTSPPIDLPERYRVLRHVASGGMAAVYAADDELLGRPVAVKVIAPAFAADENARARFMREARAAARVSDHPHVVTIYDVGETGDSAFIVMELLPGGTLNDRLRRGDPIPHDQAIAWLRQIASALDVAHRADVVHRDVKPANLLLDERGAVRVADFGIATLASEASVTQTGQVLGTAAYLSPEQALGQPATGASDRYALAVVAFELLTGRRPFTAAHPAAQARAHVDERPPEASDVAGNLPPGVDAVLARGMAKDPAERPPTASAFVDELEAALAATAATAAADPRFERAVVPLGVAIPDPDRPPTLRPGAALPPVVPRRPRAGGGAHVPPRPPATPPPRPGRLRPLALLAAAALIGGALIAALSGGGGERRAATSSGAAAARPGATTAARPAATTAVRPPATTAAPAAGDPQAVQAQAHDLIGQGSYDQAIGLLGGIVGDCPVERTDPCAYALYDLGHALRLAGRPAEAIPVLQQRLRNPDQRGAVLAELRRAYAEAGGGPGRKGKPDKGKGNGNGHDGEGD